MSLIDKILGRGKDGLPKLPKVIEVADMSEEERDVHRDGANDKRRAKQWGAKGERRMISFSITSL